MVAPTGLDDFKRALPPSYARMLEVIRLADAPMSKTDIACEAHVSPTSSGLNAGLKELLALGLIEEHGSQYRLSRDFL